MMSSPDLAPEVVIGARYRLVEQLARGGTSSVWRATDTLEGRDVAMKIVRDDGVDPALRERAAQEAAILADLEHPNLVRVLDEGIDGECPFLVMELIDGETLREVMDARGRVPVDEAVALVAHIADGLGAAHARGVVHRDVKPANIVCATRDDASDPVPMLVDFGIARRVDATTLTRGLVVGTASYLAPEQAQGAPLTPAADVYALGCVLYELLTARPPFVGTSPVNVALQHVQDDPTPAAELADVPDAVDTLLLRCLAKDPRQRPPDGMSMAAQLRDAVAHRNDETIAIGIPAIDQTAVMPAMPAAMRVPPPPPAPRRVPVGLVPLVIVAGLVLGFLLVDAMAGRGEADERPPSPTSTVVTAPPTTAPPPPETDDDKGDDDDRDEGRGKGRKDDD